MFDVTLVTVAGVVSITSALFAPRELVAPGVGSVSIAAFPAVSLMVPPFSTRAVVDR